MKILYYAPHPHLSLSAPTGYGTHMREVIAAWRKSGIEVRTLIAGDHGGESSGNATAAGGIHRLKRFSPKLVWETLKDIQLRRFDRILQSRLEKELRDFQPDLVYERAAYFQHSGVLAAKKLGVRHVTEFNAPYPMERLQLSGRSLLIGSSKKVEREVVEKTDAIVVVSSALKSHFEKVLPGASPKIVVVPNAVNPEKVSLDQKIVEEIRTNLGLNGKTVIGFVGSIFPYHGVDLLIRAFAQMRSTSESRLMIVGDGQTLPELKALAIELGVAQRVLFTGSVPHEKVYAYMELMHICCLARNDWYMSPVKLFEYGLMKKPVVTSNTSAVADVMDDSDALIVAENAEDFAEALDTLCNDNELRNKLAENWHRKVMNQYTWEIAAKKILDTCA